jgi:hypothetical protein
MPLHNQAPTTCWIPGEIITDPYTLTLPSDAPLGTYTLYTGMYFWKTGERLPVEGPNVTPDGLYPPDGSYPPDGLYPPDNRIKLTTFQIEGDE